MAGVRSNKTVTAPDEETGELKTKTYKYVTLSGKVMRQSWGSNVIDFVYDESGQPFVMHGKYPKRVYRQHKPPVQSILHRGSSVVRL